MVHLFVLYFWLLILFFFAVPMGVSKTNLANAPVAGLLMARPRVLTPICEIHFLEMVSTSPHELYYDLQKS